MIDLPADSIIACLCEGSSEKAIIDLLLEKNQLVFRKGQLLDDEPLLNYMDSKKFTDEYLNFSYEQKIIILIIGDRDSWKNLKYPYSDKIEGPYFIITKPELEMLMIHALNLYDDYNKHCSKVSLAKEKKPSMFLSQFMGVKESQIKNRKYIQEIYAENSLTDAIKEYSRKAPKKIYNKNNIFSMNDLLRT